MMCCCVGTAVSVPILPVTSVVFPVFWHAAVGGGQCLFSGLGVWAPNMGP